MRFPPANMQLRRAQLVLMLATLLPTIAMTAVGIVLLLLGRETSSVVAGVLVLTFCTSTRASATRFTSAYPVVGCV